MRAEIEAVDVIAIGRTEMFEAAMREGVRDDVTLVIGTIVAKPVIFVDVRDTIDASAGAAIDFGLGMDIAMCGRFGNAAVVGVHVVVALTAGVLAGALRLRGRADQHASKKYQCWGQSYGNSEPNPHRPYFLLEFIRCQTEPRSSAGTTRSLSNATLAEKGGYRVFPVVK